MLWISYVISFYSLSYMHTCDLNQRFPCPLHRIMYSYTCVYVFLINCWKQPTGWKNLYTTNIYHKCWQNWYRVIIYVCCTKWFWVRWNQYNNFFPSKISLKYFCKQSPILSHAMLYFLFKKHRGRSFKKKDRHRKRHNIAVRHTHRLEVGQLPQHADGRY